MWNEEKVREVFSKLIEEKAYKWRIQRKMSRSIWIYKGRIWKMVWFFRISRLWMQRTQKIFFILLNRCNLYLSWIWRWYNENLKKLNVPYCTVANWLNDEKVLGSYIKKKCNSTIRSFEELKRYIYPRKIEILKEKLIKLGMLKNFGEKEEH